jgi:hypothetical protein
MKCRLVVDICPDICPKYNGWLLAISGWRKDEEGEQARVKPLAAKQGGDDTGDCVR